MSRNKLSKKEKFLVGVLMFLALTLIFAGFNFFMARYKLAQIYAEGVERCHYLDCSWNWLGKVVCHQERVPDPDIKIFGGLNESWRVNST